MELPLKVWKAVGTAVCWGSGVPEFSSLAVIQSTELKENLRIQEHHFTGDTWPAKNLAEGTE